MVALNGVGQAGVVAAATAVGHVVKVVVAKAGNVGEVVVSSVGQACAVVGVSSAGKVVVV